MKALPVIPINPDTKSGITIDQALAELNEASRIQSVYRATVTHRATNLAIEAFLFIKRARSTPNGLLPTTLPGEKEGE